MPHVFIFITVIKMLEILFIFLSLIAVYPANNLWFTLYVVEIKVKIGSKLKDVHLCQQLVSYQGRSSVDAACLYESKSKGQS